MFIITYMPSYVYKSITYNRIPLDMLTNNDIDIETLIENTKDITDLDLLHWQKFNQSNIFDKRRGDGYQPIVDRLVGVRDTVRYKDIDITIHLDNNDSYELIDTINGIVVVIYGKNVDYNKLIDDIFNRIVTLIGYREAISDNILNCYIPYITAKLHVRRNKNA